MGSATGYRRCEHDDADSCITPDGTSNWARVREKGTQLLRAGSYAAAAEQYTEASLVASSMAAHLQSLLNGLHSRSSSPLIALTGQRELLQAIWQQAVQIEPEFRARQCFGRTARRVEHVKRSNTTISVLLGRPLGPLLPIMNAAICAAEASAAWLAAGHPELALTKGLAAVAWCAEYPTAHQAVVRALKAGAQGRLTAGQVPATISASDGTQMGAVARSSGHDLCGEQGAIEQAIIVRCVLDESRQLEKSLAREPNTHLALFACGQIDAAQLEARLAWREQRALERDR